MLYELNGKVHPMDGCQRVRVFMDAKKGCMPDEFDDLLEFIYRVYSPRSPLTRSVPAGERERYVLDTWALFPKRKKGFLPFELNGAAELAEFFHDNILTEDERTLMAYKQKLHNYRQKLKDKDNKLADDKEAMEGVEVFSTLVLKLESRVREYYADKDNYSGQYGETLFEIPDNKNSYLDATSR